MASKAEQYADFLEREGFVPETDADGNVRFTLQGELFVVAAHEEDPYYFKASYYHSWKPEFTAAAYAVFNEINAQYKVVKISAMDNVLSITTETFLKSPGDFEAVFMRCINMIHTAKGHLAATPGPWRGE